jgi:hypothetical protein
MDEWLHRWLERQELTDRLRRSCTARALLHCEDKWTRHATVVLNPPSNEPVDTTALFTPPATCHGGTGDVASGG